MLNPALVTASMISDSLVVSLTTSSVLSGFVTSAFHDLIPFNAFKNGVTPSIHPLHFMFVVNFNVLIFLSFLNVNCLKQLIRNSLPLLLLQS